MANANGTGPSKNIELWGVKQNNLKNIAVDFPLGSFTVVCGPSGSGKSSLAFETLFAEGQRRYIESLSNYARQFLNKAPKPDIEGIRNIPPAIAIEQKNSVKTSRSTVGTTTEIVDYLRLLFEKLGVAYCPTHEVPCERQSVSRATDLVLEKLSGQRGYILTPVCARSGEHHAELLTELRSHGFKRLYWRKGAKLIEAKEGTKKKSKGRKKAKPKESQPPTAEITMAVQNGELGEVIELPPQGPFALPEENFFVVIDRLSFRADDQGRISDSLSAAYRASESLNPQFGGGHAQVVSTDGQLLLVSEENTCPVCGYTAPAINSRLFSFNSPVGACSTCNGFGNILRLDEHKVIPNPELSVAQGALQPFTMPSASYDRRQLMAFLKRHKINSHTPWKELDAASRKLIWDGSSDFFGVQGLFEYLETKKYKMHVRVFISRYKSAFECPECHGSRLRKEALTVRVHGLTFAQMNAMTVANLLENLKSLKLTSAQRHVASEVLKQVLTRLQFLVDVGVTYLTLNRETRTLSGGEYQRLNLANQLGMGLSQTLFVLDEPTVGLHPRDNDRLIRILKQLNALGNTLVVVEHDHDVIKESQHVIEMGPGSGHLGGQVLYAGPTPEFFNFKDSNTVRYLLPQAHNRLLIQPRPIDIDTYRYKLELKGCRGHNLKNIDVTFPLNRLVTVTGVSGSGKSTLVSQTLYPAVARALGTEFLQGQPLSAMHGVEHIKNVLFIDQAPIGKSARSNPVTYLKVYDQIRALMASVPEAKERGYMPGTFSLNVDGGRCPVCRGMGFEVVDMVFMDDVQIPCDACDGKKFRPEILEITYKGRNVHQILSMTVSEAMNYFVAHPNIRKPLSFLKEVGLDYLQLGQSASSLSGGESQRLKIAREFISTEHRATLYILDEPTTGLHFREVEMLMKVLGKLIESGGSVILIEHNMDVIRSSDYIIDMGPEAGENGGEVIFTGDPHALIESEGHTGRYLKAYLGSHSPAVASRKSTARPSRNLGAK